MEFVVVEDQIPAAVIASQPRWNARKNSTACRKLQDKMQTLHAVLHLGMLSKKLMCSEIQKCTGERGLLRIILKWVQHPQ